MNLFIKQSEKMPTNLEWQEEIYLLLWDRVGGGKDGRIRVSLETSGVMDRSTILIAVVILWMCQSL